MLCNISYGLYCLFFLADPVGIGLDVTVFFSGVDIPE